MTRTWTYKTRKIRGEMRRVKTRTHMGKTQIRMVGVRNLTDKEARRENPNVKRVKGFVNETDGRHSSVNHYRPKKKGRGRRKFLGFI